MSESILATQNPFKCSKTLFISTLKSYLFVRYLNFRTDFFDQVGKQLDWLNLKFMTSQPGKQTIAIHMFPNISRSKNKQTIKFGQLMEYNMGNHT